MRVVIVTYLPSPYQIELCNALASAGELELSVIYLCWTSPTPIARNWQTCGLRHQFVALTKDKLARNKATQMVLCADFVVFNYYRHRRRRALDEGVRQKWREVVFLGRTFGRDPNRATW